MKQLKHSADFQTGSKSIVVLASGKGSNFAALAQKLHSRISCLVINEPGAGAQRVAAEFGIPCLTIAHAKFPDRGSFEKTLIESLRERHPLQDLKLILLAGFMRVLSKTYFEEIKQHFPNACTLNIHPAHLYEYKGANGYKAAIARRAPRWGISVHRVTPELDAGPVVASIDAPVFPWEIEAELRARMQKCEHILYVATVLKILQFPEREIEDLLACLPQSVSTHFEEDPSSDTLKMQR